MGRETDIQWCDSTVNPTSGCDGCELWDAARGVRHCYAGNIHTRFAGKNKAYPGPFNVLSNHPGRMAIAARWSDLTGTDRPNKPWLNGMPRTIFISDMSDALSKAVSFEYLFQEVIENVDSLPGRRHIWMWLTKQPRRALAFAKWHGGWPNNLWMGTSITFRPAKMRIAALREHPANVRFLSIEPLIEDIGVIDLRGIGLVIVGGESGGKARPFNVEWARSIRDQCKEAGVAFFMKQLGSRAWDDRIAVLESIDEMEPEHLNARGRKIKDSHGGDWDEWPADLRVREFPLAPADDGSILT